MRNIIITGGGMQNKGAQAMLLIAVHELRKRFPKHNIYVYSPMDIQNQDVDKTQYLFEFTGWYPKKFAFCQHKWWKRLICMLTNKLELIEAERLYRNTDLIVDISGYALGSNWKSKICSDYLDVLEFAQAFDIPIYLMPQSFGPFDFGEQHPGIDDRCRKLLPKCKAILAREQEGYEALINTYGLTNVQLAPDLVLNNTGIELNNIFKNIPKFDLPIIDSDSIAVIPNGQNLSIGDGKVVLTLYCSAVQHALDQGKTVCLLHHATQDAIICKQIKEHFAEENHVVLLEQEFSCLDFNELVKKFDYLLASRFHSIVHAYKNGIPCVILGWAKKYEDLAKQFDQHTYLFDVRGQIEEEALYEVMDRMNINRDIESQKIMKLLTNVQEKNVFDILNDN